MRHHPSTGRSDSTSIKEALISCCLGFTFYKNPPALDSRYCVFDLNAGLPINDLGGERFCRGTTRIVADKLTEQGIPAALWWVDKDKNVAARLQSEMRKLLSRSRGLHIGEVFRGNNVKFVPSIPSLIASIDQPIEETRGLLISDDNGIKVPLAHIRTALRKAPYIDVAIHVSGTNQVWSYWDDHPDATEFSEAAAIAGRSQAIRSFKDIFMHISRNHWLISEPFRNGNGSGRDHHVLYGSNFYLAPIDANHGRWKNRNGWRPMVSMHERLSNQGRELLRRIERKEGK